MLTLELDAQQRDMLIEVLGAAEKEMFHELHHADSSDYKALLRRRLELIEAVSAKLAAASGKRTPASSQAR